MRLNALSWEIMNTTADDWESLDQILPAVHRFVGAATAESVAEAIVRLIDEGLMEEMSCEPVDVQSILREPIELWFRTTSRGRALWELEASQFAVDDGEPT